jgi:hypothetical protein
MFDIKSRQPISSLRKTVRINGSWQDHHIVTSLVAAFTDGYSPRVEGKAPVEQLTGGCEGVRATRHLSQCGRSWFRWIFRISARETPERVAHQKSQVTNGPLTKIENIVPVI